MEYEQARGEFDGRSGSEGRLVDVGNKMENNGVSDKIGVTAGDCISRINVEAQPQQDHSLTIINAKENL